MTFLEQFAALPSGVQRKLLRIAETAEQMDPEARDFARTYFGLVARSASVHQSDEFLPAASMISACGLITTMYDALDASPLMKGDADGDSQRTSDSRAGRPVLDADGAGRRGDGPDGAGA